MEWLLAISILFGGWQFNRADNLADKVDELKQEVVLLSDVANNNAADSIKLEGILNANRMVTDRVSADLNLCTERLRDYSTKMAGYSVRQAFDRIAIEALESSLSDSDLSSCRIPVRVAAEIARDSNRN